MSVYLLRCEVYPLLDLGLRKTRCINDVAVVGQKVQDTFALRQSGM